MHVVGRLDLYSPTLTTKQFLVLKNKHMFTNMQHAVRLKGKNRMLRS